MRYFIPLAFILLMSSISFVQSKDLPLLWNRTSVEKATETVELRFKTEAILSVEHGETVAESKKIMESKRKQWAIFLSTLQNKDELWNYRDPSVGWGRQGFVILRGGYKVADFMLLNGLPQPTAE